MSSSASDDSQPSTEKTFSDSQDLLPPVWPPNSPGTGSVGASEWELEWIGSSYYDLETSTRIYLVKFKNYDQPEWLPEDHLDNSLQLVRCFWENRGKGPQACIAAQQALLHQLANASETETEGEALTYANLQAATRGLRTENTSTLLPRPAPNPRRPRRSSTLSSGLADSSCSSSSPSSPHRPAGPCSALTPQQAAAGAFHLLTTYEAANPITNACIAELRASLGLAPPQVKVHLNGQAKSHHVDHQDSSDKDLQVSTFIKRKKTELHVSVRKKCLRHAQRPRPTSPAPQQML